MMVWSRTLELFASDVPRFSLRFPRRVSFLQKCTTFPQIGKVAGTLPTYPRIKASKQNNSEIKD